jgi:uncharacterized protein with HEPN domain
VTSYTSAPSSTARRVTAKTAAVTREQFDGDDTLQLALTYLVQNVGEAVTRMPDDLRAKHPEIDWIAIAAMRHRLVHDYLNVDLEKVWEATQTHVPRLIEQLLRFMPADPPE